MPLSKKVVTFQLTTTGNASVTGVGFQPKLVILLAGTGATTTTSGSYNYSIGAATSSSARWAMGWVAQDAVATSNTARAFSAAKVLYQSDVNASASNLDADFVSMDADGFTVNVAQISGTRECVALCLGGTDLDVAVGTFNTGTTTGANITAVSGLSFQPKAIFCVSGATATGLTATARAMYGAASGASNEWVSFGFDGDANATMNTAHAYKTDAYLYQGTPTATVVVDIDFNTFNSDGWDHNINTAGTDYTVGYVAMGGSARFYVGNEAQKTSTGTQAKTGVGFQPEAMLTFMGLRTTSGADLSTGDFYTHLGLVTSTAEAGYAQFSDDGTADSEVAIGRDTTYSLYAITDDATPTVPAKASLSSFDSDGFTVNWNTADATARLFGFLAIGPAGASFNPAWARGSNVIMGVA